MMDISLDSSVVRAPVIQGRSVVVRAVCTIDISLDSSVVSRVGKKVVDMSIDRADGQYWLKPVNTGRLKIL
jgi:hypothetical protein